MRAISSITTDCMELGNTISRASLVLNEYVREVREARADLDVVSRELHSLQSVLDLLKDDAGSLPSKVATETPALLQQCNLVVSELDADLLALDGSALSRPQKRSQWISRGKQQMAELVPTLEAHRAVLGLALDLVGVTDGRELHDSTEQGYDTRAENEERRAEVRNEAIRIVEEMAQLRVKWSKQFDPSGPYFRLSTYCVALKVYANSLIHSKDVEDGAFIGEGPMTGAYVGDSPDSAIEVNDESSFRAFETPPEIESPGLTPATAEQYIQDVNDLMDEMIDVPSRAPTPPPKDLKRLVNQRNTMVSPFEPPTVEAENLYGVVTEISSQGRKASNGPPPSRSGRLGRIFGHMKNALSEAPTTSTSSTSSTEVRPVTPIMQASLVRRGSRRLSTSIRRLPLWSTELEEPEGPVTPGSNAIFGVSLVKSMQAAKSCAKTHHTGSGSSRREFPLCIHKCVNFLMSEGVNAPEIFAEAGDGFRVQKLKDTFSQAPKYGEDVNWDNYGVYDAADIVLLFLSQLPRPLISETIAKRWISLSKQATLSGSHGTRLDQCIDFWEEALGGLRGPARSLLKLLLNLWSSVADAADQNDMTAERLAGVLVKPLMHTSSEKYSTDYMLALAFLIRKRSEYTMMLNEGRKSRAAW
ncbi:uncharacterized protein JN550_002510 [Neoarthrinium moseri]|uniref:uncharacterized protein n=1 Tax=Neoarthrinium moseri TaxID=1658444 RepID=UPI001FDAD9CB|nr:uncharacterized protein JN550_002510 [Neoarthrinium moseri]KAI1875081.1 hypothetical protein JN550_002510 [Neoarthrinium moseri]